MAILETLLVQLGFDVKNEAAVQRFTRGVAEARRAIDGIRSVSTGLADTVSNGFARSEVAVRGFSRGVDQARTSLQAFRSVSAGIGSGFAAAQPDIQRFTQSVAQAQQGMMGLRSVLAGFAGGIGAGAALGGLQAIGAALAAIPKGAIDAGSTMENLTVRLTALEGSSQAAAQAIEFIRTTAEKTPLTLNQTADAYARLRTYGIDPTNGSLQALIDQSAKSGKGLQGLEQITSALGKAYAQTRLQGDEILSLAEAGVPIYDILTKVTGLQGQALQKAIEGAKLGRGVVDQVIVEIGRLSAGASDAMSKTWTGVLSRIEDAWQAFNREIAEAGFFDAVKGQAEDLLKTFGEMQKSGALKEIARNISRLMTIVVGVGRNGVLAFGQIGRAALGAAKQVGDLVKAMTGLNVGTGTGAAILGAGALATFARGRAFLLMLSRAAPQITALAVAIGLLDDVLSYARGDESMLGDLIKKTPAAAEAMDLLKGKAQGVAGAWDNFLKGLGPAGEKFKELGAKFDAAFGGGEMSWAERVVTFAIDRVALAISAIERLIKVLTPMTAEEEEKAKREFPSTGTPTDLSKPGLGAGPRPFETDRQRAQREAYEAGREGAAPAPAAPPAAAPAAPTPAPPPAPAPSSSLPLVDPNEAAQIMGSLATPTLTGGTAQDRLTSTLPQPDRAVDAIMAGFERSAAARGQDGRGAATAALSPTGTMSDATPLGVPAAPSGPVPVYVINARDVIDEGVLIEGITRQLDRLLAHAGTAGEAMANAFTGGGGGPLGGGVGMGGGGGFSRYGGGGGGGPGVRGGTAGTPNRRYGPGGATPGAKPAAALAKGREISERLQKEYGLSKEQATGIAANLAHESAGFTAHQEINPVGGGRGGAGWAQWTGPRRVAFEKFAAERGLDPTSDEASYQFLTKGEPEEWNKALAAVRGQTTAAGATQAFMETHERPGVPHLGSRLAYAEQMMGGGPGEGGGPKRVNYMHGQHGGPGENQTTITSPSGEKWTVNQAAAPHFQGFINDLEAQGYKAGSSGGLNVRAKRGGSGWSQHAYGNAVDINAGTNPFQNQLKTDMPANVRELAAKHGLSWGGDWRGKKDPMHFEWMGESYEQMAAKRGQGRAPSFADPKLGFGAAGKKPGRFVANPPAPPTPMAPSMTMAPSLAMSRIEGDKRAATVRATSNKQVTVNAPINISHVRGDTVPDHVSRAVSKSSDRANREATDVATQTPMVDGPSAKSLGGATPTPTP